MSSKFKGLQMHAERCLVRWLGGYELQPKETKIPELITMGAKYGIKFVTDDKIDFRDLAYDAPTKVQLTNALPTVIGEISLYSPAIIQNTSIEQVILCRNLHMYSKQAGGTLKIGFPNVNTIFIDISHYSQFPYFNRTIHHELFHAIDFRDTLMGYVDTDWHKLQGPEFTYELSRAATLHRYMGHDPNEPTNRAFEDPYNWLFASPSDSPGFVTEYAKYSEIEDKAELYSFLMVSYRDVLKRCGTDLALKRKVDRMKKLLSSFCTEYDDAFWQRIARFKR